MQPVVMATLQAGQDKVWEDKFQRTKCPWS
jgi:hypothetical protein